MVMMFDVAGLPVTQVAFEVMTTFTWSPSTGIKEYVAEFVPTIVVPTYHWYEGVDPPLVGVAVKVTFVPIQTGLLLATMLTLATAAALTVMVITFDVAGLPVGQVALEVMTTFTWSLLTGV